MPQQDPYSRRQYLDFYDIPSSKPKDALRSESKSRAARSGSRTSRTTKWLDDLESAPYTPYSPPQTFPESVDLTASPGLKARDAIYYCMWPGCTDSFSRKSDLQRHHQNVHNATNFENVDSKASHGFKPASRPYADGFSNEIFYCMWPGCIDSFLQYSDLQRHQQNVHNLPPPESVDSRASSGFKAREEIFYCLWPSCTNTFSRNSDLQRHYKDVHNREPAPLVDCLVRGCHRRGAYGFTRNDKMMEHVREKHEVDVPRGRRRSMHSKPINRSTTSRRPPESKDRSNDVRAVHSAASGYERPSIRRSANSRDSELEIERSKKYMSMSSHDSRSSAARHQPFPQHGMRVLADRHDPYPENPTHRGRRPTRAFDDRKRESEQVSNALRREANSQNTQEGVASRTAAKVQTRSTALDKNATRVEEDHPSWTVDVNKDFREYNPHGLDPLTVSPNAQPTLPSYNLNGSDAFNHVVCTGTEDCNDTAIESRGQPDVDKLKTRSTPCRSPVPSSTIDSKLLVSSGRDKKLFEDDVRDLENRLDRLLTLTEPKPPSSPGDSWGEEITSLSSFGNPDRSPGTRQHANGYQQPGASPFQFSRAPPESGRPFRKQTNQPGDDGNEGENPSGARDRGNRSSISQSSKSKRFPCVYRVGYPERFDSHTTRWEYVSQVLRHLESHNFFMCSKCLTVFTNKEQKSIHDKMRACVKICTNSACKRYTMDLETPSATCNCLLTSDDLWAATFRQAFPHLPLPAPWSSKVQSWLVAPVQNLQEEPWVHDPGHFHALPLREGAPADTAAHNGFNMQAMIEYNVEPELSAPEFRNTFPAALHTPNFEPRNEFDISATPYPNGALAGQAARPSENHSAQPASGDDVQKLREQVAILEQRFEKPSRSEQKESAMLRLAWNRLVEIGDQSVQEGGVLRQVASMLTPELIADGNKDSEESNPSQSMEMSNAMDWDAAGLGPHQLPPGGKGKQRAASRAADSAYYSGIPMN